MLRVKFDMRAQNRNEDPCPLGRDTRYVPYEDAGVAALDHETFDRNQLKPIVTELNSFHSASGRKVGGVVAAHGNCAVGDLGEILDDRGLRERPILDAEDRA